MRQGSRPNAASRWTWVLVAGLGGLFLLGPNVSRATIIPDGFEDQPVASGLDFPVGMAFLPDGRLLVVEQFSAAVKLVIPGTPATVTALVTVPNVTTGGERGLLGIAVDPGWPGRSYIYVHYTHSANSDNAIWISRFLVTGDLSFSGTGALAIDPASRYDLLTDIPDGAPNHNGGTVRFGPDGKLYVSLGEDAAYCAAQDTVSLRGVILRLDVSQLPPGAGGPPSKTALVPVTNPFGTHANLNARLVWALGLRNPFRFHVDMPTGDLYIADVGQDTWEEVDRAPAGGLDFGWPQREGPIGTGTSCAGASSGFISPIYAFDRSGSEAAIIGAGLYRRPAVGNNRFPLEYEGDYFFNDYYQGFLRRLKNSGGTWSPVAGIDALNWGTGFAGVSDWALGSSGALYYCRQSDSQFSSGSGEIRRIAYTGASTVQPLPPLLTMRAPYASPALGSATLPYRLDSPASVTVRLYDDRGRRVRTLVSGEARAAGENAEAWDGRDDAGRNVPAGIYIVRVTAGGAHGERRFPLLR